MTDYILELKDIYKNFGPVRVLTGIDFSLKRGEVRALLGANGAGKSTLIKIIGGVHPQTSGEMFLNGKPLIVKNENDAKMQGISIIYQELSLIPTMTVIENIFLGREASSGGFLKKQEMREEYDRICKDFEFDIDADTQVSRLSIAKQQMVEIMKAVSCEADIIIMDEPTTSLTNNEKEGLFKIIKKLQGMNKSIIYISHILDEVFLVCDSASIMRGGVMVGNYEIGELTKAKIAELMTGNSNQELIEKKDWFYADYKSEPILEAEHLGSKDVKDVSLQVHKGEVVGLAGLVGSKRSEIINLLYGVDKKKAGLIKIHGKEVEIKSPEAAIHHKIGLIPEDRKNMGLILDQEIYKNATAIQIDKCKSNGFLDTRKELDFAQKGVDKLGIKISSLKQKIKELSGGNQQKVVVSKWLGQDMELIIYDEPTKGIDIAAKEDIFDTVKEFASKGIGVIFISSDLEEVIRVSDRVLVVRNGSIVGDMKNEGITVQDIMNKIFDV